jgi:hypothetical protein
VLRAEEANSDGEVDLGVEGLQALEWVALALARPSTGVREAVSEAIARMFRCLTDDRSCPGAGAENASGAKPPGANPPGETCRI